jgi:hypothetical protein
MDLTKIDATILVFQTFTYRVVGGMVLCVDDGSRLSLELPSDDEGTCTYSSGHSSDGTNVVPVDDSIIGDPAGSKLGNDVVGAVLRDGEWD